MMFSSPSHSLVVILISLPVIKLTELFLTKPILNFGPCRSAKIPTCISNFLFNVLILETVFKIAS